MQINNVSNTNFQGGFRLMNLSPEVKNELPNVIKKHRQIFDNFEKQGDVFITVRNGANNKVISFIKDHKINFEFYPEIDTSSGLDNEKPWELTNLIAISAPPLNSFTQIKKHQAKENRASFVRNYIEKNGTECVEKVLKALCIDNKHPINVVKGAMVVADKEFERDIIISPPSKFKIHYVKVLPKSIDKRVERYAIDENGKILCKYQSPDGIKAFNERFCVNINLLMELKRLTKDSKLY